MLHFKPSFPHKSTPVETTEYQESIRSHIAVIQESVRALVQASIHCKNPKTMEYIDSELEEKQKELQDLHKQLANAMAMNPNTMRSPRFTQALPRSPMETIK